MTFTDTPGINTLIDDFRASGLTMKQVLPSTYKFHLQLSTTLFESGDFYGIAGHENRKIDGICTKAGGSEI